MLKSLKECPTDEDSKTKSEKSVKVSGRLNIAKYILETICPKVVYCWGLLNSFFEFRKNEQIDASFHNPHHSQEES